MLNRCYGFALCLLLAAPVLANDAPPSDESIKTLLELTDARKLLEGMHGQLDAMMNRVMQQSIDQASKGKALTARQQAIIDEMKAKMTTVIDEMLSWDKLQPLYFRLYRQTFTQDDVDGITAFYRTPAGQALLQKMPLLMTNMMQEYAGMMQPMQQRIMDIARDAVRELQEPDATPATHSG
jgi:hypothetical protein